MVMAIKLFSTSLIFTVTIVSNVYALTPDDDHSHYLQNLRDFCPPSLATSDIYSQQTCSNIIEESLNWANSAEGSKFLLAMPTYRNLFQQAVDRARANLSTSSTPVIR
jgi:hypothetical protein